MALSILNEARIDKVTVGKMLSVDADLGVRLSRELVGPLLSDLFARLASERDVATIHQIQGAIQAVGDIESVLAKPREFQR